MKILVTGGNGFIGQHLLKELSKTEHIIAGIVRHKKINFKSIKLINGDLGKVEEMRYEINKFQPEVIVHLAWHGIPNFSYSMCQNNLFDAIHFFDWIFENTECTKIILSGSCFEYGKKKGICKEFDPVKLDSYFTWAKYSLNQYLWLKCVEENVIFNWFRLFYVYGPGQREGSLIPTLIKSIGEKKIPLINTPLNKNDFVYVGDIAKTFANAIDVDIPSGVYNLGSGKATSVYDICRIVEEQLWSNKNISNQILDSGKQDETVNFWADMNKTRQAFNNSCDTVLEDGIKDHINCIYTDLSL